MSGVEVLIAFAGVVAAVVTAAIHDWRRYGHGRPASRALRDARDYRLGKDRLP